MMFSGTVLVISILALLLQVSSEAVGVQEPSIFPPAPAAAPVGVPVVVPPKVYNPVVLSQLCKDPANYCIYVDQVRPGTVRASPVNATDAQGAFLFERKGYLSSAFHVCYGGCCVDLDFAQKPGCVTMRYVNRPQSQSDAPAGEERGGHLLARFADNVQMILGPRDNMYRTLEACPDPNEGMTLPYAVIGARAGGRHHHLKKQEDKSQIDQVTPQLKDSPSNQQQQQQQQQQQDEGQKDHAQQQQQQPEYDLASTATGNPNKVADLPIRNHDYFDDVTIPLVDA